MSNPPPSPTPAALIVGGGYIGRRLIPRLRAQGRTVFATTRSPDKARELASLDAYPLLLDVTQRVTFASLRPALDCPALHVFYLVPPGRPDADPPPNRVVLEGISNTVAALRRANVRAAVLTSSTSVYGQAGGVRVDADTPPHAPEPRSKLLLQGEQLWLDAGDAFRVVRLAGLYGPGRVIGLAAVRDAAPLVGDPGAILNLIHADDAADLLIAMTNAPAAARVELGCDDRPGPRIDYYRHLAALLGVAPPAVLDSPRQQRELGINPERLRRTSSKICDNAPTKRRTGWEPRFFDFRAGLPHALAANG